MGKCLHRFFIGVALIFILSHVYAQAPIITYTTPQVYTVNTAITTLSPANTGGAIVIGTYGPLSTFASLNTPNGVAVDASGNIYATDNGDGDIYKYTSAGVGGTIYTALNKPTGIAIDGSGNVFVADQGNNDVYKFNSSGTLLSTITGFSSPYGIAVDASNNIYVANSGTNSVIKIAAGTTTKSTFLSGFNQPYGIAVDASGNTFVSEKGSNSVIKVAFGTSTHTTFASGFSSPAGLTSDAAGNIYAVDNSSKVIKKITPGGVVTTIVSGLNSPLGVTFDAAGNIYIADNGANAIKKGVAAGYTISAALPAGLSFNTSTGAITGTPTTAISTTVFTITAHNTTGNGSTTVSITVNPTAPTGTGGLVCNSGTTTLSASGSLPAGGVYTWYAALSGGASLGTGATYTTPTLTVTTTYYADYTLNGAISTPRTAVTATVSTQPVLATVPTTPASGLYLSYPFTGNANDVSGNSNNGTVQNAAALITDRFSAANSAYSFNGTSQYISTTTLTATPGPQNYTISMWFKTSSAGGMLAGFGSSQTGASVNSDRHIYMNNSGQLYFGVISGTKKTINSTATYADGSWHHVVASVSTTNGAKLYADGALVAADATMTASFATGGYWRIGYDNLTGWPSLPVNNYFTGSMDDIAIYNTELTPAQIYVLYGAGGGSFCAGNAFSLTANTVASATYAWSGPGGFTSALQNPTVPSAVAGTYVLTVTGSGGCTSTINVIAPSNAITSTWSGAAGTTNPATAGNWDQLPAFNSTSNLVIPTGLSFYPSLTADESIYGLTIASGASLNLNGHSLNVSCNIYNSSGGQILYGSSNTSQITWNGSVASQTYTGTNTANTAQLGSMTINNAVSGTLTISGGPVNIYNLLTITNGNLVVGASPASLTLKSTATQSASVGVIPAGSSITGNVTVERYITGGTSAYRGYRLLSSPVYAGTVSGNNVYSINYLKNSIYLTATTTAGGFDNISAANPTLYLYRENMTPLYTTFLNSNYKGINNINASPTYSMDDASNPSINIPVGNGFLCFFRGDRAATTFAAETVPAYVPQTVTLSASGTLNQGQITVKDWFTPSSSNLSYTAASPAAVQGYNLVGNPYASSIDWENFQTATTTTGIYGSSIGTVIYMLDPVSKNYGAYIQGTGGVGTNNASNIISSGQGFFVVAGCSCATLIFNEGAKTTTQAAGPNLLMARSAGLAANTQYLRLQLAKDSVSTDDILVRFAHNASTAYIPNLDAPYKQGSGAVSLSSLSNDHVSLAINVQPLPKTSGTIGLKVNANADGIYTLNMKNITGIPQLFDIWLMDHYKKDSLDMRHNTTYAFNLYKADTNSYGSQRFSLIVRQNPARAVHLLQFTAAKATNGAQLTWKTENEENYTNFTIERSTDNGKTFDVLGSLRSDGQGAYSFLDKTPIIGINQYRLEQEDLNGAISYSNLSPLMYSNLSNNIASNIISIYPNPASSTINLNIVKNSFAALKANNPSYDITITNSNGLIVKTASSLQSLSQANISNLLPGTYVIQVINSSDKSAVGKSKFVKL